LIAPKSAADYTGRACGIAAQVVVRWPGGESQKLTGVMGDRIIEIEELKP
jgi:hypothetical protein